MKPFPALRRLLLGALTIAALAAPGTASAAEPGINFINTGDPAGITAMASDTGARWARHFVAWDMFEPSKGQYNDFFLRQFDPLIDAEQQAGVKTMLVVTGSPQWASGSADPAHPPRNVEDYADFVRFIAARWKGKVDVIEVWNEQDESHFWKPAPDAAKYVSLLKAAYGAIKGTDPGVMVSFGPTTGNNYGFLEQAYKLGAKGAFDAVSVHTDTACLVDGPDAFYKENGRIARFTFLGYREVRASMLAQGDDKPILMSELGWSTVGGLCDRGMWAGKKNAGVSEAQQAAFLKEAYHCLAKDSYVQAALWFNSVDNGAAETELNRYGLVRFNGTKRQSYTVFQQVVRSPNFDPGGGECGDFGAPTVQVVSPQANSYYFDRLVLKGTSPDKDVLRMSFYADGQKIRNYTNNGQPLDFSKVTPTLDWQGARKLSFGEHTIKVTAVDGQGNEGSSEVKIRRVHPNQVPPTAAFYDLSKTRFTGKGRTWTFKGLLDSPLGGNFRIGGKVRAVWQNKRKGKWKKIHGGQKNSNKAFTFKQRLKYGGAWRMRVEYGGQKPFKRMNTCWLSFSTTRKAVKQTCPKGAVRLLVFSKKQKRKRR